MLYTGSQIGSLLLLIEAVSSCQIYNIVYPSLFIRYELFMMSFQIMFKTVFTSQCTPKHKLCYVLSEKKGQALVKGVLDLRAVCVSHLSDLELL